MPGGTAWRFVSAASPEGCAERLSGAMLSWKAALKSEGGALGRVTPEKVRLGHVVANKGNAWRPLFVGTIEPAAGGGSIVEGRFRVPLSTRGFVVYVGAFVLLFLVLAVGPFIVGITGGQRVMFAGMSVLLTALYGGTHAVMRFRWRGIRDEQWLVEFIATTVRATAVERGRDGWPNRWLRAMVRGWLPAVPH